MPRGFLGILQLVVRKESGEILAIADLRKGGVAAGYRGPTRSLIYTFLAGLYFMGELLFTTVATDGDTKILQRLYEPISALSPRHFAVFGCQFFLEYSTQLKNQKSHQLLNFTCFLNVFSQFMSVMPSLCKVVCNEEKCKH